MTSTSRCICFWLYSIYYLLFASNLSSLVLSEVLQEYMPRSVSAYGDGLENGQLLQIPVTNLDNPLMFSFAANITKGCNWSNVTLFLRHDGLPIVNIFNASYPNSTWVYQPIDYEENFVSDGKLRSLIIYPKKHSIVVFGVVFRIEDFMRIQQEGLTKSCSTLFWGKVEGLLVNSSYTTEDKVFDEESVELVRKNYVQPLNVKWLLDEGIQDGNVSANTDFSLNLQPSETPKLLSWKIMSPNDVGGTLQVSMKFNKDERNSSVYGCLTHNTTDCLNGSQFSLNSSEEIQKAKIIVPYPIAGAWYLSIFGNCTDESNENCQRNISIKVEISLSPCNEGTCGSHGRCIQYFSAGLIYSACVCSSGFTGWSCSDDSKALSNSILLASVLLLTLSNLFFIPAIILAYRRGFYTQSMLYFVTMFFSSFYHACDQQEFNYCIMPYSVLQFGDFYTALTSVWLTSFIVAKPSLSDEITSMMSIAGAVGIAMAVHYDPTSFGTFTVPIACGLILIIVSWIHHSKQMKACFPGKTYCLKAVLPCLFFAITGVVCFAFLETEDNYFYVHSIWHISIALAIVFIIPQKGKCVETITP